MIEVADEPNSNSALLDNSLDVLHRQSQIFGRGNLCVYLT